ncbi:hypothetical protein L596_006449 [Steinernema carpocapsae]|uniref:Uncharacterized protein n=1 Tax=Steinernema carpocapsae TaxID=34508 RepID=A0A4U8VAC5_STECR|nr:hypothetical protein L596_006449 [Steinernema carpocapsae]
MQLVEFAELALSHEDLDPLNHQKGANRRGFAAYHNKKGIRGEHFVDNGGCALKSFFVLPLVDVGGQLVHRRRGQLGNIL